MNGSRSDQAGEDLEHQDEHADDKDGDFALVACFLPGPPRYEDRSGPRAAV